MLFAMQRLWWRMSRANVRMYLLEPRSGTSYPVTTESCFASPIHALVAWARTKMGHVYGDNTPRPPCTAPPAWQVQEEEIDPEHYAMVASTIPKDIRRLLSQQSLDAMVREKMQ